MKKLITNLGLIFITAMMPAVSSCHSDGDGPQPVNADDKAVTFAASRADDQTYTISPLSELYGGYYDTFSVWGSYCTVANDNRTRIFSSRSTYEVSQSGNLWIYKSDTQPSLYWNASAKDYRFYAVASKPPRNVDVTFINDTYGYTILVKDVVANVVWDTAHELLAAYDVRHVNDATTSDRGICDQDMYREDSYIDVADMYSPANLVFHHALAVIEFRVDDETQATHNVSKIEAQLNKEISTKATYNAAGMQWRNQAEPMTKLPTINKKADSDAFDQVLEIPQQVGDGTYQMDLAVTAETGTYSGVMPLAIGWEMGKRYIYTLSISTDEKILVNVSVEPYANYQQIGVEDELVNW